MNKTMDFAFLLKWLLHYKKNTLLGVRPLTALKALMTAGYLGLGEVRNPGLGAGRPLKVDFGCTVGLGETPGVMDSRRAWLVGARRGTSAQLIFPRISEN